jgi:hypothetical protein
MLKAYEEKEGILRLKMSKKGAYKGKKSEKNPTKVKTTLI